VTRLREQVDGRVVATATVRELCQLTAAQHELRTLRAATANANVAFQKVLTKAGFVPVGPADPAGLGGKPGTRYQRDLALQPWTAFLPVDRLWDGCGRH
jgi:ribosomal-protein-alanine N-acetyltransferase